MRKLIVTGTILITCFILLVVIRLTMRNKAEPFSNTITLPCSVETTNPENNKLCQNLIDDKIARENMTGTFSSVTSSNWNKTHERVEVTDSRTNIRRNAWIPYGGEALTLHLSNTNINQPTPIRIHITLKHKKDDGSPQSSELVTADVNNLMFDKIVRLSFGTDTSNIYNKGFCDNIHNDSRVYLNHCRNLNKYIEAYQPLVKKMHLINPFLKRLIKDRFLLSADHVLNDWNRSNIIIDSTNNAKYNQCKEFLYKWRNVANHYDRFFDNNVGHVEGHGDFMSEVVNNYDDSQEDTFWKEMDTTFGTESQINQWFANFIHVAHTDHRVSFQFKLRDENQDTLPHELEINELHDNRNNTRNPNYASFARYGSRQHNPRARVYTNNFREGTLELKAMNAKNPIKDIEITFGSVHQVIELNIEYGGKTYLYNDSNLNYTSPAASNYHNNDQHETHWFEPYDIQRFPGKYASTKEQTEKKKILYTVPLIQSTDTPLLQDNDDGSYTLNGKLFPWMEQDYALFEILPHNLFPNEIDIEIDCGEGNKIPNCYLKYNNTTIWRYEGNETETSKVIKLQSGHIHNKRFFHPTHSNNTPSTWLYGLNSKKLAYNFTETDSNSYMYDKMIVHPNTSNWFECRSHAIRDKRNAFSYVNPGTSGECRTLYYDPDTTFNSKFNRRYNENALVGVNVFDTDPENRNLRDGLNLFDVNEHYETPMYTKYDTPNTGVYNEIDGFDLLSESRMNNYLNHVNSPFSIDSVSDINQCYGQWVIDENRTERYVLADDSSEEYNAHTYKGCSNQQCGHESEFVGKFSNVNRYCGHINEEVEFLKMNSLLVILFPHAKLQTVKHININANVVNDGNENKCRLEAQFSDDTMDTLEISSGETNHTFIVNNSGSPTIDSTNPLQSSDILQFTNKIEMILDSGYGSLIDILYIVLKDSNNQIVEYDINVNTSLYLHTDTHGAKNNTAWNTNPLHIDNQSRIIWQNGQNSSAKIGHTLITMYPKDNVKSMYVKLLKNKGPSQWKVIYNFHEYEMIGNKNNTLTFETNNGHNFIKIYAVDDCNKIELKNISLYDENNTQIRYDIYVNTNIYMDISTDWKSIYNTKYPTNTLHVEDDTSVTWINSMSDLSEITDPFIQIFSTQSAENNRYILPEDPFGKCTEIECTQTIPECYYHDHSNASTPETSWSNCEFRFDESTDYNDKWSIWTECTALSEDLDCRHDRERTKGSLCNIYCPEHTLVGAHWSCGSNLQLNDPCRSNPTDECGSNVFGHTLQCSTNTGSVVFEKSEFSNATCQYNIRNCAIDTTKGYSNFCSYGKTYIQLSEPKLFGGECSNEGWSYQNPIYSSRDANFLDENSNLTLFGYSNIQTNTIADSSENTYDLRISGNDTDPDSDRSNVHFPYGHFHSNCTGSNHDLCVFNSHCREDLVCDFIENRCKKP